MVIFSFRAECKKDVTVFANYCSNSGIIASLKIFPVSGFPDVIVEMETSTTLEELRSILDNVQDGHVMYQTLRQTPLAENKLNRDDALWPNWHPIEK